MVSIPHSCQFCEAKLPKKSKVITYQWQIDDIIKGVAEEYGFSVGHILGRCRKQKVAMARQKVMYRLRQERDLTLAEVGSILNRTPATISHGFQKIAALKELHDA